MATVRFRCTLIREIVRSRYAKGECLRQSSSQMELPRGSPASLKSGSYLRRVPNREITKLRRERMALLFERRMERNKARAARVVVTVSDVGGGDS